MTEPFLEGLMRGSGVVLVLLAAILLYFALKGTIKGRSRSSVVREIETTQNNRSERFARSVRSCCTLVLGAVFVLAIFYLYLMGTAHYEGVVREKVVEKVSGKGEHGRYFVIIDTIKYQVEQSLYAETNVGDTLRKPVLLPWMYVNDRKVFLEETIRDSGFWLGFVGSACAVMCLWSVAAALPAYSSRRYFVSS